MTFRVSLGGIRLREHTILSACKVTILEYEREFAAFAAYVTLLAKRMEEVVCACMVVGRGKWGLSRCWREHTMLYSFCDFVKANDHDFSIVLCLRRYAYQMAVVQGRQDSSSRNKGYYSDWHVLSAVEGISMAAVVPACRSLPPPSPKTNSFVEFVAQ